MKVVESPSLPAAPESNYDRALQATLLPVLRLMAIKVNQMADGKFVGFDGRGTAAPTAGTWEQGDEILNSNPTEQGGAGNKYVIRGWKCVASGTPGTWVQMRFLTGN